MPRAASTLAQLPASFQRLFTTARHGQLRPGVEAGNARLGTPVRRTTTVLPCLGLRGHDGLIQILLEAGEQRGDDLRVAEKRARRIPTRIRKRGSTALVASSGENRQVATQSIMAGDGQSEASLTRRVGISCQPSRRMQCETLLGRRGLAIEIGQCPLTRDALRRTQAAGRKARWAGATPSQLS